MVVDDAVDEVADEVVVRPGRSAFAAAFLSLILPGLGHAYLGRWLRALAWVSLPVIVFAAVMGMGVSVGWRDLAARLIDPDVLVGVVGFLIIDLVYRLLAMLDAYRLGTDAAVGSRSTRMLSGVGLAALVIVLVGSHLTLAQPVLFARDTLTDLTDSGDTSEIISPEDLARAGPDLVLRTQDPGDQASSALASPDPQATSGPEGTSEPSPAASGAVSAAGWDGKDRLNIVLIGSDGGRQGSADSSLLTDTMITISVDPTTGRVAFISLPRDTTGVPLPAGWPASRALGGKYSNKINTLYTIARSRPDLFPGNDRERGYKALMGTLGELYDLEIPYYVAVNLSSFRSIVNTLGGVVVDVQLPVSDVGYPADDGRGKIKLYVPPGIQRMNGQDALAYARSRHATTDFDRSSRQQRVVTSVREQTNIDDLLQPGVITNLITELREDVKTNIPPRLVPDLISLAQDIDLDRRENLVLSSSRYVTDCYPDCASGLAELIAKPAAIKSAVQNIFSHTRKQATAINEVRAEGAVVHVINGEPGANTKAVNIATALDRKGVSAIVPPVNGGKADTDDYASTVITLYNGAEESMPATVAALERTFKDAGQEVRMAVDPEQPADVVITVGTDTRALKP